MGGSTNVRPDKRQPLWSANGIHDRVHRRILHEGKVLVSFEWSDVLGFTLVFIIALIILILCTMDRDDYGRH